MTVELLDGITADDGRRRKGRTEHHALKRLTAAQRHVGLTIGERAGGIDDGMLEITLADVLRAKGNFAESLAHYERAEKYLTDKDKSILRAIPAMYGAGMASYGLARHEESSMNLRESGDLFIKSREWLNKYIESSHSSEDRLRRASAVQWIKIIDRKLEKDAIGNDIEEGE